jgi:hypothetical protein
MLGNKWKNRIVFNAEGGAGGGGEGTPAPASDGAKGGAGGADDKGGEAAKPAAVKDDAKALNDALGTVKSESDPAKDDGKGADGAKPDDKSDEQKEGDDDGKEGKEEKSELFGSPEGDYQPFTLPEGREVSPEVLALATPILKELNLGQAGAQKVAELFTQVTEITDARFYGEINEQFDQFTANPEYWKNGKLTPDAEKAYGTLRQVAPGLVDFAHRQGGLFHPELAKVAFLLKAHYGESDVQLGGKATDNVEAWRDFYEQPSTTKPS